MTEREAIKLIGVGRRADGVDIGDTHSAATSAPSRPGFRAEMATQLRALGVFGRLWSAGVLAFAVARAAIVWTALAPWGVNPWIFLAIDVATALPYGVGQAITVKLLRDRSQPAAAALPWATIVAVCFIGPYAYVFIAGGDMPSGAVAAVIAWICVFGALAMAKMRRDVGRGDR